MAPPFTKSSMEASGSSAELIDKAWADASSSAQPSQKTDTGVPSTPSTAQNISDTEKPSTTEDKLSPEEEKLFGLKDAQSERVTVDVLSYLDWDDKYPEPEAVFSPFFFFCSRSLLASKPELQKLVDALNPIAASRLMKGGREVQGQAWQFNSQDAADSLKVWVGNEEPGAYLGVDMVTISGKLQVAKVINEF